MALGREEDGAGAAGRDLAWGLRSRSLESGSHGEEQFAGEPARREAWTSWRPQVQEATWEKSWGSGHWRRPSRVSEGPETPGKAQNMGGRGTLPLPGSREETRAVSWGTGPLTLTWFKIRAVGTLVEVTTTVCWGMSMHLDVTYETGPRSC